MLRENAGGDEMKESPIIFNTAMVQAILNGSKSQTRRVIKPQPKSIDNSFDGTWEWKEKDHFYDDLTLLWTVKHNCPYSVKDRLWVREAHALSPWHGNQMVTWKCGYPSFAEPMKWRSPMFLPKWAARIWLEITEVRVERLQEITEEDALSEGWNSDSDLFPTINREDKTRTWFKNLWDSLNAKRGQWHRWEDDNNVIHKELIKADYSWESNPWVWVISFRRV